MRNYTAKAEAAFDQVTEMIHKAETLLGETISRSEERRVGKECRL